MNIGTTTTAEILNSWPRPGIVSSSAAGCGLIGRFASDADAWSLNFTGSTSGTKGYGDPLGVLRTLLEDLKRTLPFAGAIGYVSYEWGARQLGITTPRRKWSDWRIPEIQFLILEQLTHPAPTQIKSQLAPVRSYSRADLDSILARKEIAALVSKPRYTSDVGAIKEHIASGDIYQANYTQALELTTLAPPAHNQELLRHALASPYSAFLNFEPCTIGSGENHVRFPEIAIICLSPERFWRKQGATLDSRPIKGTIGRGGTAEDDIAARRRLLESSKDRAELLMITDLVRNDLGRVADIGSVRTDSLLRIRPAPSVWHLESTVSAELPVDRTWCEVMHALSPAGSISGTPKRRAVEILSSLEPIDRGPYCGAVGWVDANGDADFAVGIRMLVQSGNRIRIHGGGGIVADSDPEAEYYESLVKIAPLIDLLLTQRGQSDLRRSLRHA
jgi:para-aminobenzoate synthetase component 1